MKILYIWLLSFLMLYASPTNISKQKLQREQLDLKDIHKQYEYCKDSNSVHKKFTVKNEQWDICSFSKKSNIIQIKYKKKEMKYEESYLVRNGKLVYAFEQQMDDREGHQWIWNCQFGIVDEKQAEVLSSLGHGKTEDDNWDPNEIIDMYEKRMVQLKKRDPLK